MKPKAVTSCQIALLTVLIAVLFTVAWANETGLPREKLASLFPDAANFVEKKADLTPEKVASIEEEIGTKLRPEDLKPTFYIAVNENNKPMGLALFLSVKGPNGPISGGVGLDMTGKVIKVAVYKHKEARCQLLMRHIPQPIQGQGD